MRDAGVSVPATTEAHGPLPLRKHGNPAWPDEPGKPLRRTYPATLVKTSEALQRFVESRTRTLNGSTRNYPHASVLSGR